MSIRNRTLASLLLTVLIVPLGSAQGPVTPGRTKEDVARDLDDIARIATVMVDGDVCQRIMTKRALEKMFAVDPKDPYAASDNFDVNHQSYIAVKKTLIRLSRLMSYSCDVNLWMPFKEKPDKIQVLIRNANEWSQFWTWGKLTQDMPVEMKRVLESGRREKVARIPGMISVLAPVNDSLGEIVALVEVIAPEPGAKIPQVHARLVDRVHESAGWVSGGFVGRVSDPVPDPTERNSGHGNLGTVTIIP